MLLFLTLMVDIYYFGHSCFKIKGNKTSLVIDPFSSEKIKDDKFTADIVLTTDKNNEKHNNPQIANGSFLIYGPGEYEISKAIVFGLPAQAASAENTGSEKITLYHVEVDGLSVVHLGNLGKKLTQQQLEILGGADVLMVPVGGKYSLDAKEAVEVVAQIEPKIVLPMHYSEEEKGELATLDQFLSQIGKEKVTESSKLSFSKERLPDEMQVVVLTKS